MYFSLMFFHRYFLVASQFLTLSTLNLHSTEGWNSLCFHAGQVAACCKVRPKAEEKAAQTEKQRPSKSNRAVEDPMFFLENHWEIDTISRIVIASLEYRSVPKDLFWLSNSVPGCEDSKSGSCPQTPAVGWQMVLGIVLYRANHFQVRCGNKLGRSWKILEDLGRSWKILEDLGSLVESP